MRAPEQQVVEVNGELAWRFVNLANCNSALARVVRLVQTVQNNLFAQCAHFLEALSQMLDRITGRLGHGACSALERLL